MDYKEIAKDIIDSIRTNSELAFSRAFEYRGSNLFRGCHTVRHGCTQSYSTSIREAARFAGEDGIIVAIDTSRACVDTFDFSNYLWELLGDVIEGRQENNYSERLLNLVESCSGEDEVFATTNEDYSKIIRWY